MSRRTTHKPLDRHPKNGIKKRLELVKTHPKTCSDCQAHQVTFFKGKYKCEWDIEGYPNLGETTCNWYEDAQ